MSKNFYIHKLGCPKNDVDADYIAARLIADGHNPVSDPEQADSIIINTCGFILPAREESIEEILRLAQLKQTGRVKTIYAAGCLTQRSGDELLAGMPELDGAFGVGALDSIAKAVNGGDHLKKTVRLETRKLGFLSFKNRYIADRLPYAYLKISDGCDRPCTYCSIPLMRGQFRSRPVDSIISEASFLAQNGKKELILVSQESTYWGNDLKGEPGLVDLLRELENIEGVEWIRLLYMFPTMITQELIDHMAGDNKTLNYYDLPIQHINNDILQRMKRAGNRGTIEKVLGLIRNTGVGAHLRTTLMVGFPGETQVQFEELREFVIEQEFDRLGVFPFYAEDGAPAAVLDGQISESVKIARMDELMTLQQEIAFEKNMSLIGKRLEVIIDGFQEEAVAVGRTRADCPEVDQEVIVTGSQLEVGTITRVRINRAEGYDLFGEAVGESDYDTV